MIGPTIDNSFTAALSFLDPNKMSLVVTDGDERVKFCTPAFLKMFDSKDLLPQDLVGLELKGGSLHEERKLGQLNRFLRIMSEIGPSDRWMLAKEGVVPGNRIAEWLSVPLGSRGRLWILKELQSGAWDELSLLAFFENITDGFWRLDSDWRVLQVSKSFVQNFGGPQTEILEHRYWDLRPDLFQSAAGRLIRRSMTHRKLGTWCGSDPLWGQNCSLVAVPVREGQLSLFLKIMDFGQ